MIAMTQNTPTPASGGSTRRRQFLINPKLQLTIIGFNCVLAVLAIIIFYFLNVNLFNEFVRPKDAEFVSDPFIQQMVAEATSKLRMMFALTAAAVMCTMITGGLILSNRVAGPIYRLQKHINELISGKATGDVHFRDKDFFPELAESFNKLIAKLKSRS